jgi:N-acetyl-1-D-myo-inositol-2-amino-2-deoxy-alpha-D-glucopyranoside deacetylase
MNRRTLLGIFPHPDDEAYTAGGTMAKAAAAGADVYVLCATRGEAGHSSDLSLATPQTLGTVREDELRASCAALGIHPPRFLDYPDGGLETVDLPEAVGRIVRVIRAVRPQVVITLGPDGVYGHPDHIALHKLVTPAFRSAGGGSRFPDEEFGPSFQPSRLFWVAYPRGHFRPVWERLLTTDLAEGVRKLDPDELGVSGDQIHAEIDVRAFVPAKLAALRAHRTQLVGDDPLSIFPPGILQPLLDVERFTLAIGAPPEGKLTDLFEGLGRERETNTPLPR